MSTPFYRFRATLGPASRVAVAAGLVGLAAPAARADITTDVSLQTSTNSGSNSGFTAFANSANAANTTQNGASVNNIAAFTTSQSFSGTVGQSFEAMTAGNLTNVDVLLTGSPASTFNVALYDAGTAGTTTANAPGGAAANQSHLSDTGSSNYVVDTAANTPGVPGTLNAGGNTYVSQNLLTTTTTVTSGGFSAAGNDALDLDLIFSGADSVPLLAGEEYVVVLSNVTNVSGGSAFILRNSASATEYPDGQAFVGTGPLNGNANRDLAVGVTDLSTAAPEPTSALLVGVGVVGLTAARRRRPGR